MSVSFAINENNIKARWEEPYVSDAINLGFGAMPRGIYRGFTAKQKSQPGSGIRIDVDPDSVLIHRDLDTGRGCVVRFDNFVEIDFTFTVSTDYYVWVNIYYLISAQTTGAFYVGTLSEVQAVDNAVIICKFNSSDSTITDSDISQDIYTTSERTAPIPLLDDFGVIDASKYEQIIDRDTNGRVTQNIIPDTDGTRTHGDATHKWKGYLKDSFLYGTTELQGDLIPDASGRDIGTVSKRVDLFAESMSLYGNITPNAADLRNVGTGAGDRLLGVHAKNVNAYTSVISNAATVQDSFKMSSAKSHRCMLTPNAGFPSGSTWYRNGVLADLCWRNNGDATSVILFLDLPHWIIWTNLTIKFKQATGSGTNVTFELNRVDQYGGGTTLDSATPASPSGSQQNISLSPGSIQVDKELYHYELEVTAADNTKMTSVYSIYADYTIIDVGLAATGGGVP
jgi:hypothetical protein